MKIIREKKTNNKKEPQGQLKAKQVVEHQSYIGLILVKNPLKLRVEVAGSEVSGSILTIIDGSSFDKKTRSGCQLLSPVDSYRSSLIKRVKKINSGRPTMFSVLYQSKDFWGSSISCCYPVVTGVCSPMDSDSEVACVSRLWSLRLDGSACPEAKVVAGGKLEFESWQGTIRFTGHAQPIKWFGTMQLDKSGNVAPIDSCQETGKKIIQELGYTITIMDKKALHHLLQFGVEDEEGDDIFSKTENGTGGAAAESDDENDPFAKLLPTAKSENVTTGQTAPTTKRKATATNGPAQKKPRAQAKSKARAKAVGVKTIQDFSLEGVGKQGPPEKASVPDSKEAGPIESTHATMEFVEKASSSQGPVQLEPVIKEQQVNHSPEKKEVVELADSSSSSDSESSSGDSSFSD